MVFITKFVFGSHDIECCPNIKRNNNIKYNFLFISTNKPDFTDHNKGKETNGHFINKTMTIHLLLQTIYF